MKSSIVKMSQIPVLCQGTYICLAWDKSGIDFHHISTSIVGGYGCECEIAAAEPCVYQGLRSMVNEMRANEVERARLALEGFYKCINE